MKIRRSLFRDQWHIFGLVGLTVAYPVFSFLLVNPAYLVANGVTSKHLYFVTALPSFALPAILIAMGLTLSLIHKKTYRIFHLALIWIFLTLAFLPLLSRMDFLSVWLVFGLSAALAALVTREYRANLFTYTGLLLLAPLALALPVHFALDHNISQILSPKESKVFDWQAKGSASLPPVIMIVFDELPLVHILDAHGDIDRKRFPHFASLADAGTWYSNASTVHDQTIKAVPAILTGQRPKPGRILPVPENYPQSLFAILGAQYKIHANESLTALAGARDDGLQLEPVDARTVATDIIIFYLRSLLPAQTADAWLPLESGIWGAFLSKGDLGEWLVNNDDWRTGDRALTRRFEGSLDFFREIGSLPRNTFHYFHVAIPHRPYGYLPSGRQYVHTMRRAGGVDMVKGEINQGRAAHILQVGLADTMLGALKERLVELEYWDDAMVIVLADHGQAYRPKTNNRIVTPENFGNVAFIPLLIKYPGQKAGGVDDTNVQTIDIAPTIIDVLGVQNAPRMDGRSLLDENADIADVKTILSDSGEHYEIARESYDSARAGAHQEAVAFFSLQDKRSDLFQFGAGFDYIGEKLDTLNSYKIQAELEVHDPGKYQSVDTDATFLPVYVQGEVVQQGDLNPEDVVVAISINGIIKAVTTPYFDPEGKLLFNKILPEDALEASNDLVVVLLAANKMQVDSAEQ